MNLATALAALSAATNALAADGYEVDDQGHGTLTYSKTVRFGTDAGGKQRGARVHITTVGSAVRMSFQPMRGAMPFRRAIEETFPTVEEAAAAVDKLVARQSRARA